MEKEIEYKSFDDAVEIANEAFSTDHEKINSEKGDKNKNIQW